MLNRNQIVNKHGKPIYYFSRSNGNTELEKFRNSFIYTKTCVEYTIVCKNETLTCVVDYNKSEHYENCGYFLKVFNQLGELIEDTHPSCGLMDDSLESVEEFLRDINLL